MFCLIKIYMGASELGVSTKTGVVDILCISDFFWVVYKEDWFSKMSNIINLKAQQIFSKANEERRN